MPFSCFCVWPEECSFLTSFTVRLPVGISDRIQSVFLAIFLRSFLFHLTQGQIQFKVSENGRGGCVVYARSLSVLELYHSTQANTACLHILNSQYRTHFRLSTCCISEIHIHPRCLHTYLILHMSVFPGTALHELEREPAYWDAQARATLDAALKLRPRDHQAKNLILFLGDGRSC